MISILPAEQCVIWIKALLMHIDFLHFFHENGEPSIIGNSDSNRVEPNTAGKVLSAHQYFYRRLRQKVDFVAFYPSHWHNKSTHIVEPSLARYPEVVFHQNDPL